MTDAVELTTAQRVLAGYLGAQEVLTVAHAHLDRWVARRQQLLNGVRRGCLDSRRGSRGGELEWTTEHDGISWRAGSTMGLIRWIEAWVIVAAGVTTERCAALDEALRAEREHRATWVACPGEWRTTERWNAEFGAAWYATSRKLDSATADAVRAIVYGGAAPVQLVIEAAEAPGPQRRKASKTTGQPAATPGASTKTGVEQAQQLDLFTSETS